MKHHPTDCTAPVNPGMCEDCDAGTLTAEEEQGLASVYEEETTEAVIKTSEEVEDLGSITDEVTETEDLGTIRPTCGSCEHWDVTPAKGPGEGKCVRVPPRVEVFRMSKMKAETLVLEAVNVWPQPRATERCGQFEKLDRRGE